MSERILPPWADKIPQGAFISWEPTYKVGEYFKNFHKSRFECVPFGQEKFSHLDYYFYDPTEHGWSKDGKYPLLVFMHGYTNALVGDVCINYTGAEFYSKDEYQKAMGGAYILVPVANEYKNEEGKCAGSWDLSYIEPIFALAEEFMQNKAAGRISKKAVIGSSLGAYMCFELEKAKPDFFNIMITIGSSDIPDDTILDRYEKNGMAFFFAIARHDELSDFEKTVVPRLARLKRMKKTFVFTPEWIYNGDRGIASINFGFEMGQHCLVNPMHCNLMYDDGSPMYSELPLGVTGWLHSVL